MRTTFKALLPSVLALGLALAAPALVPSDAAAQGHAGHGKGHQQHEAAKPGETRELKQTKCPVMGLTPSPDIYTDYQGKRIYFCCDYCPAEFAKDPERYLQKLKDEGVELEDAPN